MVPSIKKLHVLYRAMERGSAVGGGAGLVSSHAARFKVLGWIFSTLQLIVKLISDLTCSAGGHQNSLQRVTVAFKWPPRWPAEVACVAYHRSINLTLTLVKSQKVAVKHRPSRGTKFPRSRPVEGKSHMIMDGGMVEVSRTPVVGFASTEVTECEIEV